MAIEFLAAIVAAIGMAGLALLARKIWGDRLPRWSVTLAAAVGLIGCTIILEYGWFTRVARELPPGVEVVWQDDRPQALRPWSMLFPLTTRFAAIDRRSGGQHPEQASLRLWTVYQFARWQPVNQGLMVFDCAGGRRVLLTEGVSIAADGSLTGAEWLTADDSLQSAACA
jgi:hypothetical protein